MKLQLTESGMQNIKTLAKEFNEAWIYCHTDTDGVTSAVAMKNYLEHYGIKVSNVIPIQYGAMEYSVKKAPDNVLPVLVDFSHGKPFMKIHTDHHESQIKYDNSSKNFRHAKSNAGTISTIISPNNIFPQEDIRVINMIDSAGYADENIGIDELKNYLIAYKKDRTNAENHLRFGMVVGKLIDALKNKPDFIKTVVMNSQPSLTSMFNIIVGLIKANGWDDLKQMQSNSEEYIKKQEGKVIPEGSIEKIKELSGGENTIIGNCIVQVDGGTGGKQGGYNRYTAFRLHPEARFYIVIWGSMGMMQVSKNNWNEANKGDNINLGDIVLRDIFANQFAPKLNNQFYDISLMAIKKTLESNIERNKAEDGSIGFNYDEFKALFGEKDNISEKQRNYIIYVMNRKPNELIPTENDSEETKERKLKMVRFLNNFRIPLPQIVMKNSGGHPGITNLTGFDFLLTQRRIFGALSKNQNPYEPLPTDWKPDPNKPRKDNAAVTILKDIAKEVVLRLNSLDKEKEEVQ